jgi:hypothetical protein
VGAVMRFGSRVQGLVRRAPATAMQPERARPL